MRTATSVVPEQLEDDEPLIKRRPLTDEARFDITAMIDLVFMLNIFFLVTTVAAALSEMDLPIVRHCVATDIDEATLVSVVLDGRGAVVHIGDAGEGDAIIDPEEQVRRVREAVEAGLRADKRIALLKAEKAVRLKDMQRVGAAASAVPGVELRLAVIEKE